MHAAWRPVLRVGSGSTLKVTPPLMIDEAALTEALDVFAGAVDDAVKELNG